MTEDDYKTPANINYVTFYKLELYRFEKGYGKNKMRKRSKLKRYLKYRKLLVMLVLAGLLDLTSTQAQKIPPHDSFNDIPNKSHNKPPDPRKSKKQPTQQPQPGDQSDTELSVESATAQKSIRNELSESLFNAISPADNFGDYIPEKTIDYTDYTDYTSYRSDHGEHNDVYQKPSRNQNANEKFRRLRSVERIDTQNLMRDMFRDYTRDIRPVYDTARTMSSFC